MKIVISKDYSFTVSFKLLAHYFSLKEIEYYCYSDGPEINDYPKMLTKVDFYEDILSSHSSCISLIDFGNSLDYYEAIHEKKAYFPLQNFPFEGRTDELLIQVIEKIGEECGFGGYRLKIVEIPDDVDWVIESDNEIGYEWIAEKHRVWK
jgi:hypothetical protein